LIFGVEEKREAVHYSTLKMEAAHSSQMFSKFSHAIHLRKE
jgi:hypothetical protein